MSGGIVGMTDRQFDSHIQDQVKFIREILKNSSDYQTLVQKVQEYANDLELKLKRP